MLNLFVLIALEQFDRYYLPKDNILARFKKDLDEFVDVWVYFARQTHDYDVSRLKDSKIPDVMRTLKAPLGVHESSMISRAT